MTRNDRPRTSGVRTLLGALDLVDLIAGSDLRHAGSVIVMIGVALAGVGVLFAVLGLTGVVLVVFGLTAGPFAWLGSAVLWAGIILGFGGAAIVMMKIIRKRSALTVLAGFAEPEVQEDGLLAAAPPAVLAPPALTTVERMRALDARLAPPGSAPREESPEHPEG